MKLAMNMIRQYADIPVSPKEYEERMIMSGTAVEDVSDVSGGIENVVVGRVLECDAVEGSDHLHLCKVDVGGAEPLQIVCGAPNVYAGALVPVAMDGAHLPGGVKIKKGKLRGIMSEGMLCAATELNVPKELYPSVGDEGLLLFKEDYPLGADVKPILGIDDYAVDFEILANRPDCLCAVGVARETAAALGTEYRAPHPEVMEAGGSINDEVKVRIEDAELCPRYAARVIKNVRLKPSPMWLRKYLHAAGLRPINNIVDITNYVMLECGHPMHAFDLGKVRGREIIVRRAHEGEKLTTLDGVERDLRTSDLLICDAEGATGLAGIMGGEESEITDSTAEVMFECACFDRTAIRLTSRALGLRTESSGRFERGVCAASVGEALERAAQLVNELDAGDVVSGAIDIYPSPKPAKVITAEVSRVCARAGVEIPAEDMLQILKKLQFGAELNGNVLTVTVPAFREDLDGEADICEEVLRMYGYDHIGATGLRGETTRGGISPLKALKNRVGTLLQGMGYLEIMNYSFMGVKELAKLGLPEGDKRNDPLAILNPLGDDTAVMRPTLVCDMLKTLAFNMNHMTESAGLYEMAAIFDPHTRTDDGLPTETPTLCVGAYGDSVDFYSVRVAIEAILRSQGIEAKPEAGGEVYHHPGRCAKLARGSDVFAVVGEVHPDVAERFQMPRRAIIAELNLSKLLESGKPMGEMKPLPRFPSMSRDLALKMDEAVLVGPLMEDMRRAAGKLLESIRMFDVYRGAQLGISKKSVAFSLAFRAPDRTLTDDEVQKAMDKVLKACEEKHGATIR